jgi:hypothetical protein
MPSFLLLIRSREFWVAFSVVLLLGGGGLLASGLITGNSTTSAARRRARHPREGVDARRASAGRRRGKAAISPAARAASGLPQWLRRASLYDRVATVERETGAQVGVAVRPLGLGAAVTDGGLQVGWAWSTMKVPVILARYRLAEEAGEAQDTFRANVALAIAESNNEAIDAIFDELEQAKGGVVGASRYVEEGLLEAGDQHTKVNTVAPAGGFSTFGQTRWSLIEGTRFYGALADDCLQPSAGVQQILRYMGQIVSYERWGVGQANFAGAAKVLFKGGWGPNLEGRYLLRQFGILESKGRGLVVGLIAEPADGSFESGVQAIDRLAGAVAAATDVRAAPLRGRC